MDFDNYASCILNTTGIVVEIHSVRTLMNTLMFFVGLTVYTVQFKLLLWVDTYHVDDAMLNVFKLVKSNLFMYSLAFFRTAQKLSGQV